jgi:acyl-CoA synthetase (NDP forming)
MVGLGGSLVEFVSDIILALAPIDVGMARCMVESLKGYQLLKGYRGTPPADVDSLCEILKRVSDLMVNFPAINGIDLNPVKVLGQGEGSVVIDCKIFLKSAPNLQWDIIPIQKALT